jgi:mannose-1-phosphate guanylyltransferase
MGKEFLHHVLDHLGAHGVHEVVLSSPYLEDAFLPLVEQRHGDPKITWITESEPLGTGGAVLNALDDLGDDPFFVLNGDILTDLDLSAMRDAHVSHSAAVTIATMHVDDARPFGLVISDAETQISEFREKPADPVPGDINAGTYLIDPQALARFPRDRAMSIEREIFPGVISVGAPVFAYSSLCYWIDLGTPEKYLRAHFDILDGKVENEVYPAPWVHPTATVDLRSRLGAWSVIGAHAEVARGAEVDGTVMMERARAGEGSRVRDCILGPGAVVGDGATAIRAVLGEGAVLAEGATLLGNEDAFAKLPAGD